MSSLSRRACGLGILLLCVACEDARRAAQPIRIIDLTAFAQNVEVPVRNTEFAGSTLTALRTAQITLVKAREYLPEPVDRTFLVLSGRVQVQMTTALVGRAGPGQLVVLPARTPALLLPEGKEAVRILMHAAAD